MATVFASLRARLFTLFLLALLLLALPLALLSAREAERAAAEDLRRALYARLFLLREEGLLETPSPREQPVEALLLELFRLGQTLGGGVGFVVGEGIAFTQLEAWELPPDLPRVLAEGRAYQGVHRGVLFVALPWEGGGFGLAVPLEGAAGLGRRLLLLYATWGGGVLLLVFLLAALGLSWALRPLSHLTLFLKERAPADLSPLPDPKVAELKPVVAALNGLLARVAGLLAELSQKEEAARRFARHASHELRTPLTALKGYLEVLQRRSEPRALAGALREAERMEAILAGLLRLSRLEATTIRPVPLDLRAFLEERAIEVKGEGVALADPELLALAVENLRENAQRHGALPLRGEVQLEGERLWLWLVDAGPGFPPELLPRVFEPFVHGGRGTGLGLALVAAVARAHGGQAVAENRGGAAVGFSLPLASLKLSPRAPFGQRG
ncbi:sensor histidine kinase [Thermus thermamylovorans]|uniref:histidine kinase n=1 Tax=Thermus thermamylovorans TaxID=2509362 RepID=A0A4Q9B2W1_9DEIN|nr:HAMP domain-containing sensor histidine kinase [Thermus thermamylovorans]TBH17619.1 HAMP domain-containing histidine kinase [Thermus thermamylovorans]